MPDQGPLKVAREGDDQAICLPVKKDPNPVSHEMIDSLCFTCFYWLMLLLSSSFFFFISLLPCSLFNIFLFLLLFLSIFCCFLFCLFRSILLLLPSASSCIFLFLFLTSSSIYFIAHLFFLVLDSVSHYPIALFSSLYLLLC